MSADPPLVWHVRLALYSFYSKLQVPNSLNSLNSSNAELLRAFTYTLPRSAILRHQDSQVLWILGFSNNFDEAEESIGRDESG